MTDARPALSNLMVCLALSLQEQYPSIFEEVGKPSADEGEGVFVYDVLSSLTGRDFDACWDALERAGAAGLIEPGSTFQKAWLTADGVALVDKAHVDLLDFCSRHADRMDDAQSQALVDLIAATPRPKVVASQGPSLAVEEGDLDMESDPDDDVEPVAPSRARARP